MNAETPNKIALRNGVITTIFALLLIVIYHAGTVTLRNPSLYDGQNYPMTAMQFVQLQALLGDFKRQCGSYPTTEQGLAAIESKEIQCSTIGKTSSPQVRSWLQKDPWGNQLSYLSDGRSFKVEASHHFSITEQSKTGNELIQDLLEKSRNHSDRALSHLELNWKWGSLGGEITARRLEMVYFLWPIWLIFVAGFIFSVAKYKEVFERYGTKKRLLLPCVFICGLCFFGPGFLSHSGMYWPWRGFLATMIQTWAIASIPIFACAFLNVKSLQKTDLGSLTRLFFIVHGLMAFFYVMNPFAMIE